MQVTTYSEGGSSAASEPPPEPLAVASISAVTAGAGAAGAGCLRGGTGAATVDVACVGAAAIFIVVAEPDDGAAGGTSLTLTTVSLEGIQNIQKMGLDY